MLGAALLWFGWFGFNAGSAVASNGTAGLALLNTIGATTAAVLSWLLVEKIRDGHATSLGAASGVVAGLVAITPACAAVNASGAAPSASTASSTPVPANAATPIYSLNALRTALAAAAQQASAAPLGTAAAAKKAAKGDKEKAKRAAAALAAAKKKEEEAAATAKVPSPNPLPPPPPPFMTSTTLPVTPNSAAAAAGGSAKNIKTAFNNRSMAANGLPVTAAAFADTPYSPSSSIVSSISPLSQNSNGGFGGAANAAAAANTAAVTHVGGPSNFSPNNDPPSLKNLSNTNAMSGLVTITTPRPLKYTPRPPARFKPGATSTANAAAAAAAQAAAAAAAAANAAAATLAGRPNTLSRLGNNNSALSPESHYGGTNDFNPTTGTPGTLIFDPVTDTLVPIHTTTTPRNASSGSIGDTLFMTSSTLPSATAAAQAAANAEKAAAANATAAAAAAQAAANPAVTATPSISSVTATNPTLPGYKITSLKITPGGINESRAFNGVLEKISPLSTPPPQLGGFRRVLRRNTKKFRPRKNKSRKHRN